MLIPNLLGWKRLTGMKTIEAQRKIEFFEYAVHLGDWITCIGNGRRLQHLYFIRKISRGIDMCPNWTRLEWNIDWFMCMSVGDCTSPRNFALARYPMLNYTHRKTALIEKQALALCTQAIIHQFFMNENAT